MNHLIFHIDFEVVITFFLIGATFGGIYFILLEILDILKSRFFIFVFKEFAFKPVSFSAIEEKSRECKVEKGGNALDALSALIIISIGVLLVLSLYALCDGVPRIYALAFAATGYFSAYLLFDCVASFSLFRSILFLAYAIYSIIVAPLGRAIQAIRHKKLKSNKK